MNKAAKQLRKSGGHAGTDPVKTGKYVTLKLVALELQTFQFLQISKGLGDETCDEKGKKPEKVSLPYGTQNDQKIT